MGEHLLGNDDLTRKDRIDALMKFADLRLTRWKMRADSEWKISLAFWGLLVLVAGNSLALDRIDPFSRAFLAAAVLLAAVVAYHQWWVEPIAEKNREDQAEAFRYLRAAEGLLPDKVSLSDDEVRAPWAKWFQMATTIVLAAYTWWSIIAR
jgi:hypothetical protein